ncbi:MAG: GNAT family N-acetyltransferase [Dehalococcoidales bacterium]|nr:GNAT family N-acetyltransferase [Dehalococcoidales bacterium]
MAEFKIRKAHAGDVALIHELHCRSVRELCRSHYSPDRIEGWLEPRRPEGYLPGIEAGEMFIVMAGGQMAGFGHARQGEIRAVYVAPEFIGLGTGTLILKHGIEIARTGYSGPVRLESTLNARGFYLKAGFVEIERVSKRHGNVLLQVVIMELK